MTYDVSAVRAHFPALAAAPRTSTAPAGRRPRSGGRGRAATPDLADREPGPGHRGRTGRRRRSCWGRGRRWPTCSAPTRAGVVFGRSMTQLTFDLARALAADWGPGDEVVVTRLDHDANIRPWVQAAEAVGATVAGPTSTPPPASSRRTTWRGAAPRTRLVAVTGASNLLGTRPPVP